MFTRRQFLAATAVGAASCYLPRRRLWSEDPAIEKKIRGARTALRISDIKVHEIVMPYHSYNALNLRRYHGPGIQVRSVFVVSHGVARQAQRDPNGPHADPASMYINLLT